jgi:hypothetical protein
MAFKKGQSGNPGGRRKSSISAALSEIVDPVEMARFLYSVVLDEDTNMRERLQAAAMINDRTEGKAISRNVNLNHSAAAILPAGFDSMSPDLRISIVKGIRRKALAGIDLAPPADENGDADELG